jgi:MATE family multidrug resistance protein
MSVTDTVMVSALSGAEALAAVAVGSDLYSIVFYLAAGVLAGFAPLYTAAVVRAYGDAALRLQRSGRVAVALFAALLVPWSGPRLTGSPASASRPTCCHRDRGYTRAMAVTLPPMLASPSIARS